METFYIKKTHARVNKTAIPSTTNLSNTQTSLKLFISHHLWQKFFVKNLKNLYFFIRNTIKNQFFNFRFYGTPKNQTYHKNSHTYNTKKIYVFIFV